MSHEQTLHLTGNFAGGLWIAFIGWFLDNAASAQVQQTVFQGLLAGHKVSQAMSSQCVSVPADMMLQQSSRDRLGRCRCRFPVPSSNRLWRFREARRPTRRRRNKLYIIEPDATRLHAAANTPTRWKGPECENMTDIALPGKDRPEIRKWKSEAAHLSAALFSLAKQVSIAGSFNNWQPSAAPLTKCGGGRWRMDLALKPGTYEYRFVVDGNWTDDPLGNTFVANPFGTRLRPACGRFTGLQELIGSMPRLIACVAGG